MKIVYLSSSQLPSSNANSVHVMKMCAAFARNHHDVLLYALEGKDGSPQDIFHIYGLEKNFHLKTVSVFMWKWLWNVFYLLKIFIDLKKSTFVPDVFYSRYIYAAALASLFYRDRSVVFEAHALPRNFLEKRLESWLFGQKNFSHLVVISQVLKDDYLLTRFGLVSEKIIVAHDGADLYPTSANQKGPVVDKHSFKLGYTGKLMEGKGMSLLVELASLCPEEEFHLWGGSPDQIDFWSRFVNTDNFIFHGHVEHGSLLDQCVDIDVFLAPIQKKSMLSKSYDIGRWTSPLKIFEYMSYCKPIIASDIPVLREILTHRQNALLIDPADVSGWHDAIQELKENRPLMKKLAQEAYSTLKKYYTWDMRAQNVLTPLVSSKET
ncbi:MAG: glycosyltransferase family 4 protein [Rhodospirillales bacterium]|nr:glycosyltransferase family 4 protein [Rhodospirillales bacterium]